MKTITTIAMLLLAGAALATGNNNDPDQEQRQDQDQYQGQEQGQGQHQGQETSVSVENAAAGGSAVNEGNEQSVQFNSNYEAQAPDVVLIPNNNTERCLRVFGLSFSNQSGGGGIGWPWRSAKCDYEQAADDAFAAGERDIGWYWKCQNSNLNKRFKGKGEDSAKAAADCLDVMLKGVTQTQMITELKKQLTALESQREDDMVEFQRKLAGQKDKCNEITNRVAETCRQSK